MGMKASQQDEVRGQGLSVTCEDANLHTWSFQSVGHAAYN